MATRLPKARPPRHLRLAAQQDRLFWRQTNFLQGKNYVYTIKPTYRPINPDGCLVMASKTKKNILITIKVSMACLCTGHFPE